MTLLGITDILDQTPSGGWEPWFPGERAVPEPVSEGREGSGAVAAGERSVGLGLPRSQLLSVLNPKAASVESLCL